MAVSKQPSIPAETSSAEGLDEEASSRGEAKWKRFHPFRVVRKIFRRRIKREGTSVSDTSKKSWSTSELQSVQDETTGKRDITSPLKIGLSVSHDSIFSPENTATNVGSEALDVPHGSSLSVHHTSINAMFKDELFTRVRARRDSDDDDVGLPHSPCNSPTTVDVLTQGLKEKSSKSQTTCSAGSLISMGSSENDEDSAGHSSGHSSKMSLLDRRSLDSDGDTDSSQPVPLNHNAAHHKIAVRPKRTYGLPRRRMNQIAAAKVSTLPSTPEVTEDNGKGFQKLDAIEVVKTFTEYSVSSLHEISSSKQSSEWQISQMTSSFSYSETPNLTSEVNFSREQSDTESGGFTKCFEDSSKSVKSETIKMSNDDNLTSEVHGSKNCHLPTKENYKADISKDKSNLVCDSNPNAFEHVGNEIIENPKISLMNDIPESKNQLIEINKSLHSQSEFQIISSSLVKNLEKSESFENLPKAKEETKVTFGHSNNEQVYLNYQGIAGGENLEGNDKITSKSNVICENEFTKTYTGKSHEPLLEPQKDLMEKTHCTKESISEVKASSSAEKLDIDNEFVLKTVQRNFNQDNCTGESSQLPALYFEEESLMSSKSLSVGGEESGNFVPHHASLKNNNGEMLVTEAHNFAAVEENVSVFIQPSSDIDLQKKKDNSEPWINSVNIPSTLDSDITVNSLSLCSSKMTDDVITISVNRKSETLKSVFTSQDVKQAPSDSQKPTVMPKLDANQKPASKEKQSLNKPLSNNLNTNPASSKNSTAQKRVSVEIVPFSQRMKERKYQPISYSNKEFSDVNKKNHNTTVERKLSDRKVIKNKESDKTNSRHSFSGALISESKKGDLVIEKKTEKTDKVQYPVQIRIHKSNPKVEVKAPTTASNKVKAPSNKNLSTDVKFQMQAAKSNQSDGKLLKDETNIQENATKWEVKIQPSLPHCNNPQLTNMDESVSSVSSESNMVTKDETHKSAQPSGDSKALQTNPEIESSSVMGQENNWRSLKETPVIPFEEPEPELLRVFARRSIKQKHCDKGKVDESCENLVSEVAVKETLPVEKSEDSEINISDNSTVIKISETVKPHISKHDLKKKSKSFCEKEKVVTRSVSPLREMNLIHRESLTKVTPNSSISNEALHPRQRLASVPDIPLNLPPDFQKDSSTESSPAPSMKEENLQRTTVPTPSGSANGSLTSIGMVKENQDLLNDKEPHAPSWLQLAQQRRELREQRERLLLGGSPNSFMDGSNKPSRSSKVWDMVNNFQKLQMT